MWNFPEQIFMENLGTTTFLFCCINFFLHHIASVLKSLKFYYFNNEFNIFNNFNIPNLSILFSFIVFNCFSTLFFDFVVTRTRTFDNDSFLFLFKVLFNTIEKHNSRLYVFHSFENSGMLLTFISSYDYFKVMTLKIIFPYQLRNILRDVFSWRNYYSRRL